MWRSLVACFVRDEEVVGSNPATPTATFAYLTWVSQPGSPYPTAPAGVRRRTIAHSAPRYTTSAAITAAMIAG